MIGTLRWRILFLGWAALEAVWIEIARLGDLRSGAGTFLWLASAACALFLALARWLQTELHRGPALPSALPGFIVAGGLVFRLTLAGLTPTLSDDIHRYLWDGRVQLAGINPYRYAPTDPALARLRDASWPHINHPDIATIYPPLTQAVFRLGAWLSPTVLMQKWLFLACEIALLLLIPLMLRRWGQPPALVMLYAWHPVAVVEVAGSGHNDPLGILCLLTGLLMWRGRRHAIATGAFALAFLSKFATVILWPFYLLRARRWLILFLALIVAGSLACPCSPHFTPGLGHYMRAWEFNSSLYSLAVSLLRQPLAARLAGGAALAATAFWLAARTDDLVMYTQRVMQVAILVTPVLEPWYLLWLLPLLCLRPSWMWLVFSTLVVLSYAVLVGYVRSGVWQLPVWVKWAEYGPLYAWLGWQGARRVSRKLATS
ncbi:MAG: DUF2029 domain-containing protein [Candidatus Omnitrophica bacterium]|nr:DUF2029 domain-containing protein [Candidatus Omnitrophota bacterium]